MKGFLISLVKGNCKFIFLLAFLFTFSNATAQSNTKLKDSSEPSRVGFSSLFTMVATGKKDNPFQFELNKTALGFIQSYIEKQGPELRKMKTWARPYFNLYDEILKANGIPVELKYLSVIESHLTPNLVSWAGAVGPWQLMPDEAARFGLKTTPVDERTDFRKSTIAAATLLKELYAQFGDWLLVVAAYNGGAGRVSRALKKRDTHSFWQIEYDLPLETRNHVKKFIATYDIFEMEDARAPEKEIKAVEVSPLKGNKPNLGSAASNLASIEVSGRFQISVIAKYLSISTKELEVLNPLFNQTVASGKMYTLKLPKDRLEIFEAHKNEILQASLQLLYSIKE
jgi:membrane-bound lytic murein transglycosylase D